MHTIMILSAGLALLALFCGLGYQRNGTAGVARASRVFIPVWFVCALINVSIGVVFAGYTIAQEAPVFAATFGLPAILAYFVGKRSSRR